MSLSGTFTHLFQGSSGPSTVLWVPAFTSKMLICITASSHHCYSNWFLQKLLSDIQHPLSRSLSLCPRGTEAFSELQSWSSHTHSVVLPVLCSIHTDWWPDLTLCFQLLQDKLRISTCDILQSVYTGVTEKIPLFLFQSTQKDTFRLPLSKALNSMTDFRSMAPRLITNAKTKLLLLIPKKCL